MTHDKPERLIEKLITYSIEIDGRFVIVENVPARVDEQTGERYFAPDVVERLHSIVREDAKPYRMVETPVFDFGQ